MKLRYAAYILLLLTLSCSRQPIGQWEELYIEQGTHKAKPINRAIGDLDGISYCWYFNESVRYELPFPDNHDWNKLTGLSLNLIDNHDNTVMVGWRYWQASDSVQLTAYYHQNGERIIVDTPLLTVGVRDTFQTEITIDNHTAHVFLRNEDQAANHFLIFDVEPFLTREILPWFGGNNTAPRTIYIHRKRIY